MDVLFNDLAVVGSSDSGTSAEGSTNLLFDFFGRLLVGEEEVFGGFAAVSDLLTIDDIPVAGLLDEALLDTDIKEFSFFGDAFSEDDVDGAALEWRSDFVLNHFDFDGVADDVDAGLDGVLSS